MGYGGYGTVRICAWCVHGVQRVRLLRPMAMMPSRCAGRRKQRLTLPAVERPRASSEVDAASEVLECCVGITGDELAVQHGENPLLIFPFDTHTWTDTDRHTPSADLMDFKRWPEHQSETWWMKGFDEKKCWNLFRHLTQLSALDAEIILQHFSI